MGNEGLMLSSLEQSASDFKQQKLNFYPAEDLCGSSGHPSHLGIQFVEVSYITIIGERGKNNVVFS